ncbi:MAG: metal-dependent transcriptional regulator [Oscillospiraceae bacterium]|jgi:Mn-dependent DtxR family transcriptional regulator|nr:metal-dependent transcriptional regulator [Oscillospiraceae bacterium]
MAIQESGEMYLETILVLSQKNPFVRSVDVSEHMNFSKPSVSRAMGILKSDGYVTVSDDGGILLTESGRALAEKIYERHKLLTKLLVQLGVSEEQATEDACKMEHDISDESVNAIQQFIRNCLKTDD